VIDPTPYLAALGPLKGAALADRRSRIRCALARGDSLKVSINSPRLDRGEF